MGIVVAHCIGVCFVVGSGLTLVYFRPFLVDRSAPNRCDREGRVLLFSHQPPAQDMGDLRHAEYANP